MDYQWIINSKKSKPETDWSKDFGCMPTKRNNSRVATSFIFKLYVDTMIHDVYLVGSFNNWTKNLDELKHYKLKNEKGFASIEINATHKDEYKFYVPALDSFFQDPAGVYFSDKGNSVVWDFQDPSSYKQKYENPDLIEKSLKVMQTDLPGLIAHFSNGEVKGSQINEKEYYEFIANCGVIKEIKNLGFNAVQFLPFAQSIDGSNWKFRYLVPFQFAIQKNWGNPDSFAKMIDMFHKEGIAVIGDFVVGHIPYKDYNIFGEKSDNNGLQVWNKKDGENIYLKEETSWGTKRLDYDNPIIRNFFIQSCLNFLSNYKVDGFRIDNVDGIIRYGDNGDGPERENGRTFLRELCQSIYSLNPKSIVSFEAHYFFEDNAKMLVHPIDKDNRALGATCYNDSRLSYFFHKIYMLEKVEETSIWKFKHIIDEKEWGKSNSTIQDFHNHDAAAGLMPGRATGSYAYDAMTQDKSNHFHAVGKIKVMESIISFLGEGRTLNLLQTFLMQTGTFEHDSSIHWFLTFNEANKNLLNFKKKVNNILDDEAFYPINILNRKILNLDEKNKIIAFKRSSKQEYYLIVINLSSWIHHDYKVGVDSEKDFELIFNSDIFKYCGFGLSSHPKVFKNFKSQNFELLDREIRLSILAPYQVLVFKEKK